MNKLITSKEIDSVMEKVPQNKNPGPNGFPGKFCQTELMCDII